MITAIAAIFVFLMVVLFHEFGHFVAAKSVGIKVNEFSIGMGPKLFQKKKGETKYSIRILPIGGYVSMEGEDENSKDPRSFNKAKPWARIITIAAGAIMNFVLAVIILIIVSYSIGFPSTTIKETIEGTPADNAGILSGDTIKNINGTEIDDWDSIVNAISNSNPEENMEIEVIRDGEIVKFTLKPSINSEDNRVTIGIVPEFERTVSAAIVDGLKRTGEMFQMMFDFISMIFKGQVTTKDISGPVGIIVTIGKATEYGILSLLNLMAFISVNLGVFNLFPLPALDGSRIVFVLIELIRGKPINPEKEGYIHFIGFVLLILLMIIVTYGDINKFNLFRR